MNYILGGPGGKTPVPCDNLLEWGLWFAQANRQVGFDKIGEVSIGTIFLGTVADYREERPVLFETLILGAPNPYPRERYCTWDEAAAGHARWVAQVSRAFGLEAPDTNMIAPHVAPVG